VLNDSVMDRITVVLGAHADTILRSIDLSAVGVVINRNYHNGQLSSLITGIENTPQENQAVLVSLVDMPFVTAPTINQVVGRFNETNRPIVVPVFNGRRGHPVLFSRSLFDELRNAPPDSGAKYVVHSNTDRVIEVPVPDEGILLSVNTQDEYDAIRQDY
jgi:molybdenum cofactor cytidylyltransferase